MTRRKFAGTFFVVALALLSSTACPIFSNIYKNISSYVPVALLAFDRIVAILIEHGVNVNGLTEAVNRVKAAFADIQTAILEYHDAVGHERETLIHAIATALKIASGRLAEFWDLLKIPNPQLAHTVKMLLDIIISTLTGFIAQLAPGTPVAGQRFLSEGKMRSEKQFRQDFNSVLDHNGLSKYAL